MGACGNTFATFSLKSIASSPSIRVGSEKKTSPRLPTPLSSTNRFFAPTKENEIESDGGQVKNFRVCVPKHDDEGQLAFSHNYSITQSQLNHSYEILIPSHPHTDFVAID